MIRYIEKGIGLHDHIAALGLPALEYRDGAWWHPDPDSVQPLIDAFTIDQMRAPIIIAIKELARKKILAFLPDWKQSNMNARLNELNEARFSRALTEAEQGEVEAMRIAWGKAKAIRSASDAHEAALAALTTFEAVAAYDIAVRWGE